MNGRKTKRTPAADSMRSPSFRERIEAQRSRIFSAMAIVDCCRCMHECSPQNDDQGPDMAGALAAAHELLDQAAGELGSLTDDLQARAADKPAKKKRARSVRRYR